MPLRSRGKVIAAALLLSLVMLSRVSLAEHIVNVPVGTVIRLRMNTHLSSASSRTGDAFTATVARDPGTDAGDAASDADAPERCAGIPVGSTVEGHVTSIRKAERMSRAGTVAITFDRLVFPNGESIPVDGTLTSLSAESDPSLDSQDEDRVEGDGYGRRAVIFIGSGAGIGAIIGAVTGGGKGAAIGAGAGAVIGTIGVLASRGKDAEVRPGYEFGMRVERAFNVDTDEVCR